jgi:hypothetical protein
MRRLVTPGLVQQSEAMKKFPSGAKAPVFMRFHGTTEVVPLRFVPLPAIFGEL